MTAILSYSRRKIKDCSPLQFNVSHFRYYSLALVEYNVIINNVKEYPLSYWNENDC